MYASFHLISYSTVPLLHSSAQHIIILERQSVNLECMPTPNNLAISWNFDRLQSGNIDFNDFIYSHLNHTLTISYPHIDYAGEFICQILQYHEIVSRTITLEVLPGMW